MFGDQTAIRCESGGTRFTGRMVRRLHLAAGCSVSDVVSSPLSCKLTSNGELCVSRNSPFSSFFDKMRKLQESAARVSVSWASPSWWCQGDNGVLCALPVGLGLCVCRAKRRGGTLTASLPPMGCGEGDALWGRKPGGAGKQGKQRQPRPLAASPLCPPASQAPGVRPLSSYSTGSQPSTGIRVHRPPAWLCFPAQLHHPTWLTALLPWTP